MISPCGLRTLIGRLELAGGWHPEASVRDHRLGAGGHLPTEIMQLACDAAGGAELGKPQFRVGV